MIVKKGIDVGYTFTKDSDGLIIPSKISTKEKIMNDSMEVILGAKKYYVGEGEITTALNKTNDELTKVLFFTTLALSEGEEFDVVTGLPVSQYKTQKEALQQSLLSMSPVTITVNGKKKTITLRNLEVFPQGAGAFCAIPADEFEGQKVIVVDWGGRTVDICCFEVIGGIRKLLEYVSLTEGTLTLYSRVVNAVNSKYDISLPIEEGENIVNRGLFIYGQKQDTNFIKDYIEEQIDRVFKELNLNYPIKTARHILCGGGAELFKESYIKRVPGTILLPNSQFANAIGFKIVGDSIWETEIKTK